MLGELLAPLRCVACGAWAEADVCAACAEHLTVLAAPLCARCGGPVREPVRSCADCATLLGFGRSRSLVAYGGPASRVAVALKHRGRPGLAFHIGALLADLAARDGLARDRVAFVPAGSRAAARGFDHAELLARAAARRLGRPVCHALVRVGSRRRQSEASIAERRGNAADAFRARPVRGGVLLVDDVLTTGATAEACALALLGAGADQVDVVTWARTLRRRPGGARGRPPAPAQGAGSRGIY